MNPDACPHCDGPATVLGAGPDGWVICCDDCGREWTLSDHEVGR